MSLELSDAFATRESGEQFSLPRGRGEDVRFTQIEARGGGEMAGDDETAARQCYFNTTVGPRPLAISATRRVLGSSTQI
jgi:hypothetical protein